jgi:hypothetical protein
VVVFDDVLISTLFNRIRVVWYFTCIVWKIAYIIVVSISYSLGMIRGGL